MIDLITTATPWVCGCIIAVITLIGIYRVTGKGDKDLTLEGMGGKLHLRRSQAVSPISEEKAAIAAIDPPPLGTAEANEPDKPSLTSDTPETDLFWLNPKREEVEEKWGRFRAGSTFATDEDFWTTLYITTKRDIGIADTRSELSSLSKANNSWVWPDLELASEAIEMAEWKTAEVHLERALKRRGASNAAIVLTRVIAYSYQTGGISLATQKAHTLLQTASGDERSAIFGALAAEFGEDNSLAKQGIKEFQVRENPNAISSRFDAAYGYGEMNDAASFAMRHYIAISERADRSSNVDNNLGVLYAAFGKRTESLQRYESAVEKGNALAVCNLAVELADSGFLGRAEKLMKTVTDFTGHEARKAQAEAKISALHASATVERADARSVTLPPFEQWETFIGAVRDEWLPNGGGLREGIYRSSNGTMTCTIEGLVAKLSGALHGSEFQGIANQSGIFWEASLTFGTTVLGQYSRRGLLGRTGRNTIQLAVLQYGSNRDKPDVIHLDLVEQAPGT